MCDVYNYLKSMKGKNIILSGWKAAGITSAINEGRAGVMPTLNPYIWKIIVVCTYFRFWFILFCSFLFTYDIVGLCSV